MPHNNIDALRLRYQSAFTAYSNHASRVVAQTETGAPVPRAELQAEALALWELAKVRRELLDALNDIDPSLN